MDATSPRDRAPNRLGRYVAGLSTPGAGRRRAGRRRRRSVDRLGLAERGAHAPGDASRTDGALFVGTPNFTPLWREVTASRDPGSTEQAPVVAQGRIVRFLTGPPGSDGDPWTLGEDWPHPRVVVAQHGSDGVTWWSPSLLWSAPDWLREPRGEDVHPDTRWYPVVTFWQVTADLFFSAAADVPMGHGHHFELEYADGFAAVLPPEGWTREDTEVLRSVIAQRHEITVSWPPVEP